MEVKATAWCSSLADLPVEVPTASFFFFRRRSMYFFSLFLFRALFFLLSGGSSELRDFPPQ